MLEHVHVRVLIRYNSKTSLFRISCLSQVDWLDFLLIHSYSVTVHLPVEAQHPSTSMGLHGTAVNASKVDGHWIKLWLCPSHRRSASLGVNGEWAGLDAGLLRDDLREGLRKTELPFDWQPFSTINVTGAQSYRGFCKLVKRQTATYFMIFAWRNCETIFCIHFIHFHTHNSLFQFNRIPIFPCSSLILFW